MFFLLILRHAIIKDKHSFNWHSVPLFQIKYSQIKYSLDKQKWPPYTFFESNPYIK